MAKSTKRSRLPGQKKQTRKQHRKQTGGNNVHYVISCHGSVPRRNPEEFTEWLPDYRGLRMLHTYVEYGETLANDCAVALQLWLTRYGRDPRHTPRCSEVHYADRGILKANLQVRPNDPWRSGVVDVTNGSRILYDWTGERRDMTLDDVLEWIDEDFLNYYGREDWGYQVHVLTCLAYE